MSKICLIITGGIAGYKSLYLIRLLRDSGYEVLPIMTNSATEFITPLTVATLAGNKVHTELFDLDSESEIGHINYSRQCDLIVVTPATANFIAKMAHGIADDLASSVILAANKPVVIAPAMNTLMWENLATVDNVKLLQHRGIKIIAPQSGGMACGETGVGRMAEPETIFTYLTDMISANTTVVENGALSGKHYLITVGGTSEPIDPVRIITNKSSGKQGFALAQSLLNNGAKVSLVKANTSAELPSGATVYNVESAENMLNTVENILAGAKVDGAIFCSAVADYRVKNPLTKKHKKEHGDMALEFEKNPDIMATVCSGKNRPQLVIGFNADTDNLIENGQAKLKRKNCDVIISNLVDEQIFGGINTNCHIITKDNVETMGVVSKTKLSEIIVKKIINNWR